MPVNIPASSGIDSSTDMSPGNLLDCLITDLQLGKEPASLRVPLTCSISMTTVSSESLVPAQATSRRCRQEDNDRNTIAHLAPASGPPSEYSSSVYSKRSSAMAEMESGETTISSFPADEILTPRPLDLSNASAASAADCPHKAVANDTNSETDDSHSSATATLPDPPRPMSIARSHTSSDSNSEALIKEIVRHPMGKASLTHRLTQTSFQSGHFILNQKAARLLGLDGAGYVSYALG